MGKTVRVTAAVICRENKIFATQRGYGDYKDWWEFPGGKIESGESPEQALKREILEELAAEISVGRKIMTVEYDYPTFHLSMDCFVCTLIRGEPELLEHLAAAEAPVRPVATAAPSRACPRRRWGMRDRNSTATA